MEIQKLQPNLVAKIRSSSTINSITQCITELVLNSLDANSTAIAVRVNLVTFRIQVVDNGDGIIKHNLSLIGERYMTNKCNNLNQLQSDCAYYGFKGEALASIINISELVEITSKPKDSSDTWSKNFNKSTKGDVISVKDRPSCGTTVTIQGFLYNLPLRKKRVVPELEFMHVKKNLECLIIMHPKVSFSLRNDVTGELILNNRKCSDIISSFKSLHPEINGEYSLIKVSKSNVTVKGMLFKDMFENNNQQYIYVNKRPVKCSKVQSYINGLLQNKKHVNQLDLVKNKHPVYIINIKCPYSFVDVLLSPTKTAVEFENWNIVLRCIEKLIFSFLGRVNKTSKKFLKTHVSRKKDCGISQIYGVVKSNGFKRKMCNATESVAKKMQKINTQNIKADGVVETLRLTDNHVGDVFTESEGKKPVFNKKQPYTENKISEIQENCLEITNVNTFTDISGGAKNKNHHLKKVTEPVKQIPRKNIHPLPIKVLNKNVDNKKNSSGCFNFKIPKIKNVDENNVCNKVLSTELNVYKPSEEKSFLSKFTNDENKGKNLIMDMFLKSTQVYNSEDEQNSKSSVDTVLEVESNYFLENNITTNCNGKSKTMSVSVNIKKTIKKKCKLNKKHTVSKSIQTSLDNKTTKCVQTSMKQKEHDPNRNDVTLAENYTLILSTNRYKTPAFKFAYQNPFNTSCIFPTMPIYNTYCQCCCHEKREKIFDFGNEKFNKIYSNTANNFFNIKLSPIEAVHRHYTKNKLESINKMLKDRGEKKWNRKNELQKTNDNTVNCRSPYFSYKHRYSPSTTLFKGNKLAQETVQCPLNCRSDIFCDTPLNMDSRYTFFNPQYQSTQTNNVFGTNYCNKNKQYSLSYTKAQNSAIFDEYNVSPLSFKMNSLHNFNRSRYNTHSVNANLEKSVSDFKIQRKYSSTMSNVERERKTAFLNPTSLHQKSPIPHQGNGKETDFDPKLVITLSNRQKEEILQNELNDAKENNNGINLEWRSQIMAISEDEDTNQHEPQQFEKEWIKKRNEFGSNFYINKRTGFTTFYTPKVTSSTFKLFKRLEFVPKGLSPILTEIKLPDESLSQNRKDKLETYILQSHQDELLVIKWQNYIKNNDPKTFFDEVYKEKLNLFENCIPSACRNKKYISELSCPVNFDKELFNNIRVIGQVDKKFIAVLETTRHLILLFDQHAVHERIRLETLLTDYSNNKDQCYRGKFLVFLSCNDLSLLRKHEDYLDFLGLHVDFFEDGINVVKIPSCLYNKFKDNDALNASIQLLIREIIDLIKETRGVTFKTLPKIIQNTINLEACRGAIKFGDKLENSDCEQLLKKLSLCSLPFQCAHGRPTVVPLLNIKETPKVLNSVDFKKLVLRH